MAYVSIIRLMMFKDQASSKSKGYSSSGSFPAPAPRFTFSQWQIGFIVKNATEEFTIRSIASEDNKPKNEGCVVTLENKAGETRLIKGSTLRSGYEFVSTGDVVIEAPAVADVAAPARDDVEWLGINIAGIREFYARKHGEGSRVLMMDKTAYIVADTTGEVAAKIAKAGGYVEGMNKEARVNPPSSGEAQG